MRSQLSLSIYLPPPPPFFWGVWFGFSTKSRPPHPSVICTANKHKHPPLQRQRREKKKRNPIPSAILPTNHPTYLTTYHPTYLARNKSHRSPPPPPPPPFLLPSPPASQPANAQSTTEPKPKPKPSVRPFPEQRHHSRTLVLSVRWDRHGTRDERSGVEWSGGTLYVYMCVFFSCV